jgi:hypothetical protein
MKKISIADARRIAESVGARGVAVIAFTYDEFAGTTYGTTKAECAMMGKWLDKLCADLSSGKMPAPAVGCGEPPWPGITQDSEYDAG